MTTDIYKKRIKKIQKHLLESETLLVFGAENIIRNKDVEYKFRQDSNFYYLTGINQSNSILIVQKQNSYLFLLPRDKEREIWTGFRLDKKQVKQQLELTDCFDLEDWTKKKEELLTNQHTLYYKFGENSQRDLDIIYMCKSLESKLRDGKFGPSKIIQPEFLHTMRMYKDKTEITKIKEAIEITKDAHIQLMIYSLEGMVEYDLESIVESIYIQNGAWGGGYEHIIATGSNATVLHYVNKNSILKKGELVLIDSGAEKDYYTADVTRVFPVDRKFNSVQKDAYSVVLEAQKKAIQQCKKKKRILDIHEDTVRNLSDGLKQLKLLKGSLDSIIEKQLYKKFYMHKTSHWLGMDVHDVGKYFINGQSMELDDGMILTIEPGLYFSKDDSTIPKAFRGIGIRIEDNVLVNKNKPINLTADIPKEIEEIEKLRNQFK